MPYRTGFKDERRTSNNDVTPLRNLSSFVFKNPIQILNDYFYFYILLTDCPFENPTNYLRWALTYQRQTQPRQIGDDGQRKQQNRDERQ